MVNGECRCPPGQVTKRFSDRTICMPGLSSSSIGGGAAANIVVPAAPTAGSVPSPQTFCTGGRVGTPPNCYCPAGTQWTGRACLQIAVAPSNPCPPGFAFYQGRCVQTGNPQIFTIDPGTNFGGGRRPPKPPTNFGGGSDGTQRSGGPAPMPLPPSSAGTQIPSGTGGGVLKQGGSGAAQALRCQAPRRIINGVCACPGGASGANCENPYLR